MVPSVLLKHLVRSQNVIRVNELPKGLIEIALWTSYYNRPFDVNYCVYRNANRGLFRTALQRKHEVLQQSSLLLCSAGIVSCGCCCQLFAFFFTTNSNVLKSVLPFQFLLGSLVHLLQKDFKDIPWHAHLGQDRPLFGTLHIHNLIVGFLFIIRIHLFQTQIFVEFLDFEFFRTTHLALAVVLVQKGLLFGSGQLMVRLGKEPTALFILNVRSHLANLFGRTKAIQIIVLRLKVDAHGDQNVPRRVVRLLVLDIGIGHGKGDAQVKTIKARLVRDNQLPPFRCQIFQFQHVAQGIRQLSHFRLQRGFEHEIEQLNVIGMTLKVSLHHLKGESFNGHGVVNGNVPNLFQLFVPTGLSPAGNGRVHNIVRHQQPGLQPFNGPTQNGEAAIILIGNGPFLHVFQNGHTGIHHH
mmetsp:Transcript_13846/g.38268  ORF Transcript_13846/g.38268 Transcript_13846/m.38268 type:complete len:410 (+) Transcript_13846:152-1381(+)